MLITVDRNSCLGTRTLPSRQAQEWTTPTEKTFSVSVSPYIACVEALGSDDEESKRHHGNTTANHTPRARPGRVKTIKREATDIRNAKGGIENSALAEVYGSKTPFNSCYFLPMVNVYFQIKLRAVSIVTRTL